MKKVTLSLVTILAASTFAMAGGDIDPIEPMVDVPSTVTPLAASTGGFYIGAGYGAMSLDLDRLNYGPNNNWKLELDMDTFMLQSGYKINDFFAIEGRYWGAIGDGDVTLSNHNLSVSDENAFDSNDVDAWGIYVKPIAPITEAFDVYALLGYANTDTSFSKDSWDDGAFSWGIGAAYSFSENVSLFVDYVSLYDDTSDDNRGNIDVTVDSINFGATYQF